MQLLGLRPALFFLPFLPLEARPPSVARQLADGLRQSARHCGRDAEYVIGVEPFFPVNEASRIIYLSRDIGESNAIRIPSTFSSAHAYGGTMVGLVPLLVLLLESRNFRERALGAIALCCAALGVFACGARLPFIGLLVVAATIVIRGVRRNDIRVAAVAIGAVLALTVSRDERLQRFETLSDSAYVGSRFEGSVNENLLEILAEHPVGRGLGSAVGTSIPYFLSGIEAAGRPRE